jgi:hypothetical protein
MAPELLNAARLNRQRAVAGGPSKRIFATVYCDRVKSYGSRRVDEGGPCVLGGCAFYIMSFMSNPFNSSCRQHATTIYTYFHVFCEQVNT